MPPKCAGGSCPPLRSSGGSGRQADPGSYNRASLGSATLRLPSCRVPVEGEATFLRSSSHCRSNCRNWSCGYSSHFPLTRPLRGNPGPRAAGSPQQVLRQSRAPGRSPAPHPPAHGWNTRAVTGNRPQELSLVLMPRATRSHF